jgi:hypothetical protein
LSGAIASKQPGKAFPFPLQAATGTPETEKPSAVFTALGFMFLAEREGFEPSVRSHVRLISSQVQSTTLPPLRSVEAEIIA